MDEVEERIAAARRTGASMLSLHRLSLEAVPESVASLTGLSRLMLAGNRLAEVPEFLRNLTALTWLDLSDNELPEVPEWLGELTALTRLDLTANRLTALPESLGSLASLTRIDLAGNHITAPPKWLTDPTPRGPLNTSVQAWIDDACTTVGAAADLDALLERRPAGGVTLTSEDGVRRLHLVLGGDRSGLVWEDEHDVMLSWGPVPPGAPPGLTAGDAEYAFDDPWFSVDGTEPFEITEADARLAGHEFLRTGRRPINVQWVDKP